jgi:hypothetical protein
MNLEPLAILALVFAALPCGLFLVNLSVYRPLPKPRAQRTSSVSVLIPARNEEQNIRATVASVLANHGIDFEVVVLDDHSTDDTAKIISEIASRDSRVRLETAPPLPAGWCGKQHACHTLAQLARNPLLVFIDADVRLAPDALARLAGFMEQPEVALASGVPRQELGTISERLLIPLIHFILLGFLPMRAMRRTKSPAFSAGCGQLFIARRAAYQICGGHAQLRDSLHDGIKLPRVFRRAGFATDLFDATDIATCRMYHTNAETWRGLGKNATEGLAAPGTILPMTALLGLGQILPFLLMFLTSPGSWAFAFSAMGGGLAWWPRAVAARRFRQSWLGALLHPLGVLLLLGIQWQALLQKILGRPMQWKGRSYLPAKVHDRPSTVPVTVARILLALACFGWFSSVSAQADSTPVELAATNLVCPGFELPDQFQTNHTVTFPHPDPMILIVADKQGSEQIDGWVTALKASYTGRLDVVGVADAGGAPGWVHGMIRKSFRKKYSYPILIDWSGRLPALLHCQKDSANVYLLNRNGGVVHTEHGSCGDGAWQQLTNSIELVLKPR